MATKKKKPAKKKLSLAPVVKRRANRRYWVCIIGDTDWNDLPYIADFPMRKAVCEAFKKVTGHYANDNWSGWSADKKAVDRILKAWR